MAAACARRAGRWDESQSHPGPARSELRVLELHRVLEWAASARVRFACGPTDASPRPRGREGACRSGSRRRTSLGQSRCRLRSDRPVLGAMVLRFADHPDLPGVPGTPPPAKGRVPRRSHAVKARLLTTCGLADESYRPCFDRRSGRRQRIASRPTNRPTGTPSKAISASGVKPATAGPRMRF
jgi:hypothetical protein